jgi:hypothetical protein
MSKEGDILYMKLHARVKGEGLHLGNIVNVCVYLMEYSATFSKLKGEKKKRVVLDVLIKFIESSLMIEEPIKSDILRMIEYSLPVMIDCLVAASKKYYNFKSKRYTLLCLK